ncbi:MAG: TM2 domain-containing protein [Bifidobacterium sp.]
MTNQSAPHDEDDINQSSNNTQPQGQNGYGGQGSYSNPNAYAGQQGPYAPGSPNSQYQASNPAGAGPYYGQNNQHAPYAQNAQYAQQNPYVQAGQNPGYNAYGQPNWQANPYGARISTKSKIVAGLLAIFFGVFGVHNFYLGRTGRAVAQLLISVLTFGIGAVAVEIWTIVEGIFILASHPGSQWHQDGEGYELQD